MSETSIRKLRLRRRSLDWPTAMFVSSMFTAAPSNPTSKLREVVASRASMLRLNRPRELINPCRSPAAGLRLIV